MNKQEEYKRNVIDTVNLIFLANKNQKIEWKMIDDGIYAAYIDPFLIEMGGRINVNPYTYLDLYDDKGIVYLSISQSLFKSLGIDDNLMYALTEKLDSMRLDAKMNALQIGEKLAKFIDVLKKELNNK